MHELVRLHRIFECQQDGRPIPHAFDDVDDRLNLDEVRVVLG